MIGVYFLYLNKELQYIGQSKNINNRLKAHKIEYDFVGIIICDYDELRSLEANMIKLFKPKLNHVHNTEPTVLIRIRKSKLAEALRINSEK